MAIVLEGGCLCGAVRYVATAEPMMVGNCYCVDCRKSSGTSHCTHAMVPDPAFSVTGEIKYFDSPADSGSIVSRGFCPNCGSAILSRNTAMVGITAVRVSSLDELNAVEPQMTVYASRAPSWAILDTSKPVFEEMPVGGPLAAMI
ncbi:MAG: hypothetical protein RL367_2829 [Pseudomonadota bacterium]